MVKIEETRTVARNQQKTVLVVEDEPLILALSVAILKRQGYRVLSAADGVEGAVQFAREFQSIDILVTDISLPGMRGPDLARFARQFRSDLKVLFASGSLHLEVPNPTTIIEGSAYLSKPFTTQELLSTVQALLDGESLATLPAIQQNGASMGFPLACL